MENINLNSSQLKAIKHTSGPLLIIAGAGTGKTTVITERIKYLISGQLAKPSEILALTFTEKAALEMEERVDVIMPYGFTQMWISTFHSFCDRILRDEALHIGLDYNFTLMTEAETILFLKKHLFDLPLDYFRPHGNPTKFLAGLVQHFSRLKDEDITPENYLAYAKNFQAKVKSQKLALSEAEGSKVKSNEDEIKKALELAKAYQKYEELKVKAGVMDFADLISNTLKLFRTRKNVLAQYQKKFKYILVDEFQDTNIAQNELVILLAGKKANLTVVADDDQSIYKWRGAAVSNVLQFRKTYPQAKIITLTQNYRSTQEILNRAYDLIQHNNPDRLEVKEKINKKLISVRNIKGKKIKFIQEDRVENEADAVAQEIKKLVGRTNFSTRGADQRPASLWLGPTRARGRSPFPPETDWPLAEADFGWSSHLDRRINSATPNYNYGEIAILVRANDHADSFVHAFLRHGIPFQFLGPGKLLRQEEVKDLIAYLKILYNFEDNIAFFRILSLPIFNLSARDIAALRNFARKNNFSLFEAAEKAEKIFITQKSKEALQKIVQMIHRHLELIPKQTAGQILYYFLQDSGLLAEFAEYKTVKEEQKVNNIKKFFDKLKTYESEHEDTSVFAVVDWLNLKMEMGESPLATDIDWTQENKVNILTVHSSKGLEFPVVFLVNLVGDRFPTRQRREQIPIPDDLIKETLPEGDSHQQEERRLFYVGMTRARDLLYFAAAKFYGEGKRTKKISPFIREALGEKAISPSTSLRASNQPFDFAQGRSTISNQLSVFDFKPVAVPEESSPPKKLWLTYVSYSQVDTFSRCPLQYRYKYILGIPAAPHHSASFGTSVHATLRDFYQNLRQGQEQNLENLLLILEKNWVSLGYQDKKQERMSFSLAKKLLADFYKKFYDPRLIPKYLEQNFKFPLKAGLIVGGKIDRIDEGKTDEIEIIDYKTGEKLPTQKEVDRDLQLTLYAMAAGQKHFLAKEPESIVLSLLFLKQGEKLSTRRTKEDLQKTHQELLKIIEEMEISSFSPTPNQYICKFCEYKLLCPAWQ